MISVQLPASSEGISFSGVVPEAHAAFIDGVSVNSEATLHIILVPGPQKMEEIGETLSHQLQIRNSPQPPSILFLPPPAKDPDNPNLYLDIHYDRISALSQLLEYRDQSGGKPLFIITTPDGFFSPIPPPDELKAKSIEIEVGQKFSFDQLAQDLGCHLDYDHEIICEEPGQFAIRGGLIDVYPVNERAPIRIDFFGDEIESIRRFDPITQISRQVLKQCRIQARGSLGGTLREKHIFDYLHPMVQWIFIEVSKQEFQYPNLFTIFERNQEIKTTFQDLFDIRKGNPDRYLSISDIEDKNKLFEHHPQYELKSSGLQHYRIPDALELLGLNRIEKDEQSRTAFLQQCKRWQDQGDRLICTIQEDGDKEKIKEIIQKSSQLNGLRFDYLHSDLKTGYRIEQNLDIPNWPELNAQNLTCITRHDIFGLYKQRAEKRQRRIIPLKKHVDQLLDFSELAEGDYLVHLSHGICIYRGLQKMEIKGRQEDVIALEFDDHITLYITLQDSYLLSRYVGIHKWSPKLGRIGSNQWEKTRRAAEEATLDYAASMLKLQATRESHKGIAFSPDNEWTKAFEESFPFVETPDQLKAIQATKRDMESPQPMDRLICGDVGFGKTEVAMRAAFKAVMDGKQVAVLVPTTVLAQQHYSSFMERMRAYPVMIEMLSRFRSSKEQKDIIKKLSEGKLDIVIGTHRLISNDVHFSDLGLLIIDEEHRFGVKDKEKLKSLREHVDVLSMSATPIPRTLYMALMGARHLSVIETPPSNRLPIKTIVKPYSPELVSRAIEFELKRGGQVFYLHNRVQTIAEVAKGLESLLPKARIAVGHGQMREHQLEKIMSQFVAGDYDILICTTIIESGLDIPNCNTIIIESADRMGLSQLYQLRGRVGRFNRQAYAYLLLHRHGHMIDQARKRLSTMRQYNQLGSGFKIAMRDLELRGSGNLLGMQQSGHIAGVGFDLYCQLLRQSIARLKGEKSATYIRCTIDLDFVQTQTRKNTTTTGFQVLKEDSLEVHRVPPINAHIPVHYIAEPQLRIDLYRQLSMLNSIDALDKLKSVINDRFGPPPEELENLFLVTKIRILAEQAHIVSVETESNRLKCRIASGKNNDYLKIGKRFPRLTRHTATLRLHEIITFLKRQISLHHE